MAKKQRQPQSWPYRPDRSLITSREKGRTEAERRAVLEEPDDPLDVDDEDEAAPEEPT
jgi:hypothetical protein